MIFWLLTLLSFIGSCIIAAACDTTFLGAFVLGAFSYCSLEIFSTLLSYGVSMWLGRNGQYVLREKIRYYVSEVEEGIYYAYNSDYDSTVKLPRKCFDEIYDDPTTLTPYIDIEIYNNGGWRRVWLIDTQPDECRYILHEPMEDET